jgi:predicted ArsR family transcriptional regulator
MTLDEVILRALEGGQPVTVNDVTTRFMVNVRNRVRTRLEKLRVRGVVVQEGRGGRNREFTYRLLRPDRFAKAISEKGGGLARASKQPLNGRRSPPPAPESPANSSRPALEE